ELPDIYQAAPAPAAQPRLTLVQGMADASTWPDLHPVTPATPRLAVAAEWPDLTSAGLRLAAADERPALDAPTEQIPAILARALEVFEAAGDDRLHSETLATALGTTPVELAAALREHGVTPLDQPFKRGGVR